MRRFIGVAVVVIAAFVAVRLSSGGHAPAPPPRPAPAGAVSTAAANPPVVPPTPRVSDDPSIARAIANHQRDVRVDGSGIVFRVLPDDNQGDRHQRFLVRLPSGRSVLITHNIDIAPRIPNLRVGDSVAFEGEFVWNDKGGLVHWTHHDPSGRHRAGWLERTGRRYQ